MSTPAENFTLILHLQSGELHLRELAECADSMEQMLRREQERLRKRVERTAAKIPEGELRSIFFEDSSEEWEQLARTFPELVRSAFFSKSVSAFETYLLRAAKAHQTRAQIALVLGDLRGDGLFKAKLYFTKVAGLPFPAETEMWADLTQFAEIRNYVVHADSVVPPDHIKKVKTFVVAKFPELMLGERGRLQFSDQACGRFIALGEAFLKEFRKRLR